MNYIEQIINLDLDNLMENDYQKISEVLKEVKNKGHKNMENYYVVYPFAIEDNPPYKPILFDNFLSKYKYGKHIKEFLIEDNKNKEIFIYNKENGEVREVIGDDIKWIDYDKELSKYSFDSPEYIAIINQIKQSLSRLIKTLPKDISQVKSLISNGAYSETTENLFPLLQLTKKIHSPQIFEFFIQEYPQFKEYFDNDSEYNKKRMENNDGKFFRLKQSEESLFSKILGVRNYNNNIDEDFCYIALKEKIIGKKDFTYGDGSTMKYQLYLAIKKAIKKNDLVLLNEVLSDDIYLNVLLKMSNDDKSYDEKLSNYVTSVEVGTLLKNKGFRFLNKDFHNSLSNEEAIEVINDYKNSQNETLSLYPYTILGHGENSYKKIEVLLKLFPEMNDEKVLNNYMHNIFSEATLPLISVIMKKMDKIDLTKYDIFLYLLQKGAPIEMYKQAIDLGADPRNCEKFIETVINHRDGMKCVKLLNKEGIVLAKNPDYLFHVLRNKPNKTILSYFEKNVEDICSKYTFDGNLAWWGANNLENLKWMISKASNLTQNGKDNQSILYYFAKMNSEKKVDLYIEKVIDTLNSAYNQFEKLKINTDYVNEKNGNHLLHELCKINVFNSGLMNINVIEKIEDISENSLGDYINLKNKDGYTPIEILVDGIKNEKSDLLKIKRTKLLNHLIEKYQNKIILNVVNDKGVELVNEVLDCVIEDVTPIVEKIYMNNINVTSKIKKPMLKF